jgi:NADPH-ferrihemoprotein reductase
MDGNGVGEDDGDQEDAMVDEKPLQNMDYFVFGLGNTTYAHYNVIGKRIDKRLQKCGANRLMALGLGDDDKRFEFPFNFKTLVWKMTF